MGKMTRRYGGLHCPRCQKNHFRVVRTFPCLGEIRRLRRCLGCGLKVTTVERFQGVAISAPDGAISIKNLLAALHLSHLLHPLLGNIQVEKKP